MKKIILLVLICFSAVTIAEQNHNEGDYNSFITIYSSIEPMSTVAVVSQAGYKAELYTCSQSLLENPSSEWHLLQFFGIHCSPILKNETFYKYKKSILKNRLGKKVNLVISGSGVVYTELTGELYTDAFTYSININDNGSISTINTVELVGSRVINTELDVPTISTYRASMRLIGFAKARMPEID